MVPDALHFERFDKKRHRRENFDCGEPRLNEYLQNTLNQQMKRGIAVGYVLADLDGNIAGYVTLSAGELPVSIIPPGRGYPIKLPLPTTLIGRLAVDNRYQGRGLGSDLLIHALRVAVDSADRVASAAIEVDALSDRACCFYEHLGFSRLPDDSRHLYLPMADAKRLIEEVFGNQD